MSNTTDESGRHDAYAAFRHAGYRFYAFGWLLVLLGTQMQSVALQWELYVRTERAIHLGLVGLIQVIPAVIFMLPGGHLADAYDRRKIIFIGLAGTTLTSVGLAACSILSGPLVAIYALLFFDSMCLTLARPSRAALLPLIVPGKDFSNAVTWNSSLFQMAMMVGPALGGVVVAVYAPAAFMAAAAGSMAFAIMMTRLTLRGARPTGRKMSVQTLLEGIRFVKGNRLILAAMSLDMFAVLLGGATYLLPIYARDILQVGEVGFGAMRAAPAVGAFAMALWLAHRPPMRGAGRKLLIAVAGFGIATIIFGVSQWFWLSLVMLLILGVTDNISVVVRHTVVQLATPDEMRGRVSAVNGLFIGVSNELGGFESGIVAEGFGPVASVVSGGIGTLAVVGVVAAASPGLRRLDRLEDAQLVSDTAAEPSAAGAK